MTMLPAEGMPMSGHHIESATNATAAADRVTEAIGGNRAELEDNI
jgi:hypothetical protein